MSKWVYEFGDAAAEGRADMRELLGGKGANLAEMSKLGLPVPAGFTVTTAVCTSFYDNDHTYPPEPKEQVAESLQAIERGWGEAGERAVAAAAGGCSASGDCD